MVESDRSCVVQVTTSSVHISSRQLPTTSADDDDGGCGSVRQPWILRAPTGQHIRVHLLDFTAADSVTTTSQQQQQQQGGDDDDDDGSSCRLKYGYVRDETPSSSAGGGPAARRQASICADQRRDKLVFDSSSNVVHVVLNRPPTTNGTDSNFLVRFYGVHYILVNDTPV